MRVRLDSIETRLRARHPDESPVFALRPGETRRIVIDGVPFDVTRDEVGPATAGPDALT